MVDTGWTSGYRPLSDVVCGSEPPDTIVRDSNRTTIYANRTTVHTVYADKFECGSHINEKLPAAGLNLRRSSCTYGTVHLRFEQRLDLISLPARAPILNVATTMIDPMIRVDGTSAGRHKDSFVYCPYVVADTSETRHN